MTTSTYNDDFDHTVPVEDWAESIGAFLELEDYKQAMETLERALVQAENLIEFQSLLNRLLCFPKKIIESATGTRLHLRLLGNTKQKHQVIENCIQAAFKRGADWPFLYVYQAWIAVQQERCTDALRMLEQVKGQEEELSALEHILACRVRGLALGHLPDGVGWEQSFEAALANTGATGRLRANVLMEYGGLLTRKGEYASAICLFSEAEALFPAEQKAWALESMGLTCLHMMELDEALHHLQRKLKLEKKLKKIQSRTLSSLAAIYRVAGEWPQAEELYTRAIELAEKDSEASRNAQRGLGHTFRLAGNYLRAIIVLQQATQVLPSDREQGNSKVHIDLAAAQLGVSGTGLKQVMKTLACANHLSKEGQDRAAIVQAEVARRQGDQVRAKTIISELNPSLLWVREEAHMFPDLFDLLEADLRPKPLPRRERTKVEVRAIGKPEVKVNGRRVRVPQQALVVLVALLEAERYQLLSEELVDVLDDGKPRILRRSKQRVSKVVGHLREALGWRGSVIENDSYYYLDAQTHWCYDVTEAQKKGLPIEDFLIGNSIEWAVRHGQYLRQSDSNYLSDQSV